jgi:hypothetical protein
MSMTQATLAYTWTKKKARITYRLGYERSSHSAKMVGACEDMKKSMQIPIAILDGI